MKAKWTGYSNSLEQHNRPLVHLVALSRGIISPWGISMGKVRVASKSSEKKGIPSVNAVNQAGKNLKRYKKGRGRDGWK